MRRSASTGRSGSGLGPDHGGFGGSDGARARQGGAVSGEAVAGQAGRAPDPAFAEAAGADASAAGGADATELRDDPALRLATGDRAGTAPLGKAGRLPSQPTLSRRVAASRASRCCARGCSGYRRLKAMGGWRRPKTLVIDVDSLPAEVCSAWNGYYARVSSDRRNLRLREGQVHTADGGLEFVPRGAGAGGAASVREGRRALRRGISRRAAERRWRSGARTMWPGCATTPC